MNALVVYDTYFGNTENVAKQIVEVINKEGTVSMLRVDSFDKSMLKDLDLLIIGSPTRVFKATKKISNFLNSLSKNDASNIKAAIYDTRMNVGKSDKKLLKFMANNFGYAADSMTKALKRKGFEVLPEQGNFFVEGTEGPLSQGELEHIVSWTKEIIMLSS